MKRIDATGAVRVFSAGDGLPWGVVTAIATDDAGVGAVALVASMTRDGNAATLFCLYHPEADRWQTVATLPVSRSDWFAAMTGYDDVSHFQRAGLTYHIAVGAKCAVLVPYISTVREPLILRYDRATGGAMPPLVAPVLADGDTPFVATFGIARRGETLYLATNVGLHAAHLDTGNVQRLSTVQN